MNQRRLHFIAGSNIFHKLFFRPGIPLLKLLFTFFFQNSFLQHKRFYFFLEFYWYLETFAVSFDSWLFVWVCIRNTVCMSNVRAKLNCRSFKSLLSTMLCNQSQTVSWQCQLPDSISAHFLFIWLICLTRTVAVQTSLCYSTLTGKQPVTVKHKQRYSEAFHVSVRHFSADISECYRRHARRREKWETVRERPRWMVPLYNTTIVPSHFHQWDACEINVSQSILARSECMSGMFHEPELVLQLQWRMPIYIPGVSFHYFYLHAAVFLPDQPGICSI